MSVIARFNKPTPASAGEKLYTLLLYAGGPSAGGNTVLSPDGGNSPRIALSSLVRVSQGQTIYCTFYQSSGNNMTLTSLDSGNNRITIKKVSD